MAAPTSPLDRDHPHRHPEGAVVTTVSFPPPVEGRECGGCNVCCVIYAIVDPALTKAQNVRCPNSLPDNRCGIHDRRPQTCRDFLCGWRLLRWVHPGLRPDLSGVMIRVMPKDIDGSHRLCMLVTFLTDAGLDADGAAEAVAAAVADGVPVFLHIQGADDRPHVMTRVDEVLVRSVRERNKPELVSVLRTIREHAGTMARQKAERDAQAP